MSAVSSLAAQASTATAAMVTIPSLPLFSSLPLKVGARLTSVVTFPSPTDLLPPPQSNPSITATAGVMHTASFLPSTSLTMGSTTGTLSPPLPDVVGDMTTHPSPPFTAAAVVAATHTSCSPPPLIAAVGDTTTRTSPPLTAAAVVVVATTNTSRSPPPLLTTPAYVVVDATIWTSPPLLLTTAAAVVVLFVQVAHK